MMRKMNEQHIRVQQPLMTREPQRASSDLPRTPKDLPRMTQEQFRSELLYQVMISTVRKMQSKGLLSSEEYGRIQGLMLQKDHPPIGSLAPDGCQGSLAPHKYSTLLPENPLKGPTE